jgi:hypothetical protein
LREADTRFTLRTREVQVIESKPDFAGFLAAARPVLMFPGAREIFAGQPQGRTTLNKPESRALIAAFTLALAVATQFAVVTNADAKAAKCSSRAVPGSPGTFIVTCSTKRP